MSRTIGFDLAFTSHNSQKLKQWADAVLYMDWDDQSRRKSQREGAWCRWQDARAVHTSIAQRSMLSRASVFPRNCLQNLTPSCRCLVPIERR